MRFDDQDSAPLAVVPLRRSTRSLRFFVFALFVIVAMCQGRRSFFVGP